jgi:3-(3-hydroxy-phenyl)propionate hydroxylase
VADDLRYDEVTGRGFVLVTIAPLSPEQQTLLAGRGTEVLHVAPGSPLHTWLTDSKATAALVRPDFTVLRAGSDVSALCEAAPTFLAARGTLPALTPDLRSEL